jgi:hypothetical protein
LTSFGHTVDVNLYFRQERGKRFAAVHTYASGACRVSR